MVWHDTARGVALGVALALLTAGCFPDSKTSASDVSSLDSGQDTAVRDTVAPVDTGSPDVAPTDAGGDARSDAQDAVDGVGSDVADGGVDADDGASDAGKDTLQDAAADTSPDVADDVVTCPSGMTCECTLDSECLDDDVCNGAETCDLTTFTCVDGADAQAGTPCDDGLHCTTGDQCKLGICDGATVDCDTDGLACTVDDCVEAMGGCVLIKDVCDCDSDADCPDSDLCDGPRECVDKVCTPIDDPVVCTPSDQCHAAGVCIPATGACTDPETPFDSPCVDGGDPGFCREGVCKRRFVSAGTEHTCALIHGNVRCWGRGAKGQLGLPDTTQVNNPSTVTDVSVGGEVIGISADVIHTCAVLANGDLRCWGDGLFGVLGTGTSDSIGVTNHPSAVDPISVGGPVTAVSTGAVRTCALLGPSGDVRCWGTNASQLGYPDVDDTFVGIGEVPSDLATVTVGAPVKRIASGGSHTCIIDANDDLRCWGSGSFGVLGYGHISVIGDNESPADAGIVPLGAKALDVAAASEHTCVVTLGGTARCWGRGDHGRLGYGTVDDLGGAPTTTPAMNGDVQAGSNVSRITAGEQHTCVLLTTGAVRCWGAGQMLGLGITHNIGDTETPAMSGTVDLGGSAVAIDAGTAHTCAVMNTGQIRCWGQNGGARLGHTDEGPIGDTADEMPPTAVPL